MNYRKAKKLQNGSRIFVKKTNVMKTVVLVSEELGAYGKKHIDILCDDGTTYYEFEVETA